MHVKKLNRAPMILGRELDVRSGRTAAGEKEKRRVLQALHNEIAFFDSGGYGKKFRSNWRPTLLLRDSPACINYRDPSRTNPCRECLLFYFVPPDQQDRWLPCHYIPVNREGETIADFYARGSQELLDRHYRKWLQARIRDIATQRGGFYADPADRK